MNCYFKYYKILTILIILKYYKSKALALKWTLFFKVVSIQHYLVVIAIHRVLKYVSRPSSER